MSSHVSQAQRGWLGHFLPLGGKVQAWGSPTSGWQAWISFPAPAFRGKTALGKSPFPTGALSPLVATPEEETVPFSICSWVPRASYSTWHVVSTQYMLVE